MPQPAPTFEIDFRGWQTYGQFGSNMGIFENQKTQECRLVFTSQDYQNENGNGNYTTGPVKKVASFGDRDTFAIYEGPGFGIHPKCRYFVDYYQAKLYNETPSTLALIKTAKPIAAWNPSQKHYQDWLKKQNTEQGMRLETVVARMPL